jgi:1-acyl-sn-glycerol-3-phosphate acyltransferase
MKKTIQWARQEWGIFARRDEMGAREMVRWLSQWVPFGLRTVGYGTVSLTLGPFTREHAASTWAMKAWSKTSLTSLDIDATVRGEHRVPPGGLLYASNHQSLLDILVLGAVLPGDLKWAAKRSLLNIPFLGWHLALSGHVPVERRAGRRAAVETIHRFEQVLRAGKQLLVFPEGTRSDDGTVRDFKNGGFHAAVRAGAPVVPVALDGTYRLMGKHASDTGDIQHARRVLVEIGEPIFPSSDGKDRNRVDDLRDRVRQTVVSMHERLREELEPSRS